MDLSPHLHARRVSLYILLILLTFSLASCSRTEKRAEIAPGSPAPLLKSTLGEPSKTWTPASRPQAQLLEYRGGCTYQIEQDAVLGVSCPPVGGEGSLQYWRHKWVGQEQKFEAIPGSTNIHGQRIFQLAFKKQGTTIIYDEAADRVIRVVKHGKP